MRKCIGVLLLLSMMLVGCTVQPVIGPASVQNNQSGEEHENNVDIIEMTEEEKNLLAAIFPMEERIRAGKLFEYQEEALNALRAGTTYLKQRYPLEPFTITRFSPATKATPWGVLYFQDDSGTSFFATVTSEDAGFRCADTYYAVRMESAYDTLMERTLGDAGYTVHSHTSFPNPVGEEFPADGSVEELLALYPNLNRITNLYLRETDAEEGAAAALGGILQEAGLYGSYTIFRVPDSAFNDLTAMERNALEFPRESFQVVGVS